MTERNNSFISAADADATKRPFLRKPDFPLGEVSIIAGAGGIGKGQFATYVMMCLSVGIDIRTGQYLYEPCNSLFISSEDTAADIRLRLDRAAVDGDLHRVFICDKLRSYETQLSLSNEDGLQKIENLILETESKFVVIDPLQAFCGNEIDLSRTNHIRQIMHRLSALAERTESVICLLCHPNKRQSIASANDLISGSTDIVSASRSVLLMMPDFENDEPDCRLIIHTKSNHAKCGQTIRFRIAESNSVVGLSDVTAADAVEAVNNRKLASTKRNKAVDFEAQFIDGIKTLLSDRDSAQISFGDFVRKFAPTFRGQAKRIIDGLQDELSAMDIFVTTATVAKSPVRVNGERGFRCYREDSIAKIDSELPL